MVLPPMVGEAPRPGYGDLKPIIVSLHPLGCQRRKTGFSSVHPAVEPGTTAFLPGGTTELPCGRAPGACNAGLKPPPGRHQIDDESNSVRNRQGQHEYHKAAGHGLAHADPVEVTLDVKARNEKRDRREHEARHWTPDRLSSIPSRLRPAPQAHPSARHREDRR